MVSARIELKFNYLSNIDIALPTTDANLIIIILYIIWINQIWCRFTEVINNNII